MSYRKAGEQLSGEEKKKLGLRANARMPKAAFCDLSGKGRTIPLTAHEQTILRASRAYGRATNVASEKDVRLGKSKWQCLAPFPADCPGCMRPDGKLLPENEVPPTGPYDCLHEACAITFVPQTDEGRLFGEPTSGVSLPQNPRPWWQFW